MQIFCTFCPLKYDKGMILKLVGTKMHIFQGWCQMNASTKVFDYLDTGGEGEIYMAYEILSLQSLKNRYIYICNFA